MLANFFLLSLLAQKHKWIFLKLVICCYLLIYLFMLCPDCNSHLAFPNKFRVTICSFKLLYVYCRIGWQNGHNIKYLIHFLALYRFSIHILTLTCGHELWVVIEERLWI